MITKRNEKTPPDEANRVERPELFPVLLLVSVVSSSGALTSCSRCPLNLTPPPPLLTIVHTYESFLFPFSQKDVRSDPKVVQDVSAATNYLLENLGALAVEVTGTRVHCK